VAKARETLRDLRVAEVVRQDLDVGEGGAVTYRTKLSVSFKYEDS
jgi:flavin-binding protein dodecin